MLFCLVGLPRVSLKLSTSDAAETRGRGGRGLRLEAEQRLVERWGE